MRISQTGVTLLESGKPQGPTARYARLGPRVFTLFTLLARLTLKIDTRPREAFSDSCARATQIVA